MRRCGGTFEKGCDSTVGGGPCFGRGFVRTISDVVAWETFTDTARCRVLAPFRLGPGLDMVVAVLLYCE